MCNWPRIAEGRETALSCSAPILHTEVCTFGAVPEFPQPPGGQRGGIEPLTCARVRRSADLPLTTELGQGPEERRREKKREEERRSE